MEVLDEVVSQTLEAMAFMVVTRAEGDNACLSSDSLYCSKVEIKEPVSGEFELIMEESSANNLAKTVFASDLGGEELAAAASDLLAEFANTMAGRLAGELGSKEQPVALGLPIMERRSFDSSEDCVFYAFEDGRCFGVSCKVQS
ncbi:MAG: hypothetical protein CSA62_09385 [Planctomycetota bacterium]|nr:MAG: hypothetical protein CSA62_09385 [Planctomycetota bacterium]